MFSEMLSFFGLASEKDSHVGLTSLRTIETQSNPILADLEDDSAQRWIKLIRD